MKTIGIIGGEQHIGEITALTKTHLRIVGVAVRPDLAGQAEKQFAAAICADYRAMLQTCRPELVAIANENDLKADAIVDCLQAGCDVICDKPLALTPTDQRRIEQTLLCHPERKLLNLLTLRGNGVWRALRETVRSGRIGIPAFTHVRMAVRLKREQRPLWFLDARRSGGLFLDLLIHGLDQIEWLTDRRIVAVTANMGNLGHPDEPHLTDNAAVYCELDDNSAAVVEGQRMLPDSKASDYRVHIAGSQGYADLLFTPQTLTVTDPTAADQAVIRFEDNRSIVADWLEGGALVPQDASLRANRLALAATESAVQHQRVTV